MITNKDKEYVHGIVDEYMNIWDRYACIAFERLVYGFDHDDDIDTQMRAAELVSTSASAYATAMMRVREKVIEAVTDNANEYISSIQDQESESDHQ